MSPFCGATDTTLLEFWWGLLWVSKPELAALFTLQRGKHVAFPYDLSLVLHLPTSW